MKSFLSLPQNGDFFTRYATLTKVVHLFSTPAQIVSAITEGAILFALAWQNFTDILNPALAPYAAAAVAVIGTVMLELGIRSFTPYAVRAILHRRFAGLDLVMSAFILATTAALLTASGVLSFQGSRTIVEAVAVDPEEQSTAPADSVYQVEQAAALASYRADSAAIAGRYAPQLEAARASTAAAMAEQRAALRNLEAKERSTGQSFRTQKATVRERMAAIEAAGAAQVATLTGKQGEELSAAHGRRVAALESAKDQHAVATGKITATNEETAAAAAAQVNRHGNLLGWLTVVCLLVVISSVTLKEVHHKGAGIDLQVQPSEYDFRAGWIAEGIAAFNNRFQYLVRSRIAAFDQGTPDPPLPMTPGALYAVDGFENRRYQVQLSDQEEEERVIVLAGRRRPAGRTSSGPGSTVRRPDLEELAVQYVHAEIQLESENLHAAAKDIHLKAIDVIRAYLGPDATDQRVMELYNGLVEWLNGEGPNPFEHLHRRPIGFRQAGKGPDSPHPDEAYRVGLTSTPKTKADLSNMATDDPSGNAIYGHRIDNAHTSKNCAKCGKEFSAKHWNARYCSDECRIAAWEARTGRKFDTGASVLKRGKSKRKR